MRDVAELAGALPVLSDVRAFDRVTDRWSIGRIDRGAAAQVRHHPVLEDRVGAQRLELRVRQDAGEAATRNGAERDRLAGRRVPAHDAALRFVQPGLVADKRRSDLSRGCDRRNCRGIAGVIQLERRRPQLPEFHARRRIDLYLEQVARPTGLDRRLVDDVVGGAQNLPGESGAGCRLPVVRNAAEDASESKLNFERRLGVHEDAARVDRGVPQIVHRDRALVAGRQRRIVRRREVGPLLRAGRKRGFSRLLRAGAAGVERAGCAERDGRELDMLPPRGVFQRFDVVGRLAGIGRHVVLEAGPEVARPIGR